MAKRKAISKRTRFEVFKRDSFKCQYCGRSAPDVTLEIEHIVPVSKGGDNGLMNLVTSCVDCNSGKSDVLLDDTSAMARQKRQADELNERRVQLEMMVKWKQGLSKLDEHCVEEAENYWHERFGTYFTQSGREQMRKNIRSFGLAEVLECIDIAANQYSDSAVAFKKVGAIANVRKRSASDPAYEVVCIVRGIANNQYNYVNHGQLEEVVREALERGATREQVIACARRSSCWSQFVNRTDELGAN